MALAPHEVLCRLLPTVLALFCPFPTMLMVLMKGQRCWNRCRRDKHTPIDVEHEYGSHG